MSGWFNIAGVLITMDIEKSSDSLGYSVTILVLKKFGFGENVFTWREILFKDHQSYVINGGTTTQCFILRRLPRWPNLSIPFNTEVRNFNKRYRNIWALFPSRCIFRWYDILFKDAQSIENKWLNNTIWKVYWVGGKKIFLYVNLSVCLFCYVYCLMCVTFFLFRYRCFPEKLAKLLWTAFYTKRLQWLLLEFHIQRGRISTHRRI